MEFCHLSPSGQKARALSVYLSFTYEVCQNEKGTLILILILCLGYCLVKGGLVLQRSIKFDFVTDLGYPNLDLCKMHFHNIFLLELPETPIP